MRDVQQEGEQVTYDDDFARLNLSLGAIILPLTTLGLEWPPPERLVFNLSGVLGAVREARDDDPPDEVLRRESFSQITDEQRAGMTHVARGAEYRYADAAPRPGLPMRGEGK